MDEQAIIKDVKNKVVKHFKLIQTNLEQYAELQAEIYVSSTLGLQSDFEGKEQIKNFYAEEFINEVKRRI